MYSISRSVDVSVNDDVQDVGSFSSDRTQTNFNAVNGTFTDKNRPIDLVGR